MRCRTLLEELASESNTTQAQEEYYSAGLIAGREPRKLYVIFVMVFFHKYLEIAQFVWDRAVCGTRYWVGAGCARSCVAQKIHTRKIRQRQGPEHDDGNSIFLNIGAVRRSQIDVLGPRGPCRGTILKTMHGSKNLLQRASLYRHKRNNIRPG